MAGTIEQRDKNQEGEEENHQNLPQILSKNCVERPRVLTLSISERINERLETIGIKGCNFRIYTKNIYDAC
jgi:hypothetical protein